MGAIASVTFVVCIVSLETTETSRRLTDRGSSIANTEEIRLIIRSVEGTLVLRVSKINNRDSGIERANTLLGNGGPADDVVLVNPPRLRAGGQEKDGHLSQEQHRENERVHQ